MIARRAQCSCGALRVETRGEPVRISACHCLDCQRRTGSAFGAQARFPNENVAITGVSRVFMRTSDDGGDVEHHFCGECGSTVFWRLASVPGFTSVAIGAFADPAFPAPTISVYEIRRHPWATVRGAAVEHLE